jgi:hypothetical protein
MDFFPTAKKGEGFVYIYALISNLLYVIALYFLNFLCSCVIYSVFSFWHKLNFLMKH